MEQWIGSVHSKMAWQTHFKFGVYRVLEKSSSYIHSIFGIPCQDVWLNIAHILSSYLKYHFIFARHIESGEIWLDSQQSVRIIPHLIFELKWQWHKLNTPTLGVNVLTFCSPHPLLHNNRQKCLFEAISFLISGPGATLCIPSLTGLMPCLAWTSFVSVNYTAHIDSCTKVVSHNTAKIKCNGN